MILPGERETGREPHSGTRYLCRYCQEGNVAFLEKIGMYQKDSIPSHLVYSVMTASLQDSNNVPNQTQIICHLTPSPNRWQQQCVYPCARWSACSFRTWPSNKEEIMKTASLNCIPIQRMQLGETFFVKRTYLFLYLWKLSAQLILWQSANQTEKQQSNESTLNCWLLWLL